jgi:uncharacterized DUF497 family protein
MNSAKLNFDWSNEKALNNHQKHNISFEEAMTVWNDEFAALIHDPSHSINEERFIIIGYSYKNNLLFVSFTERDDKFRIISARKATKTERKRHEENKEKY